MDHLSAREALIPAARRLPLRQQLAAVIALAGARRVDVAVELGISESMAARALSGSARTRPTIRALAGWAGLDAEALEAEIRGGDGQ